MHLLKKYIVFILSVVLLIISHSCSYKRKINAADVSLLPYYSSNMVFQRGEPVHLKGNCSPSGVVGIKLKNSIKYAKADEKGNWEAILPPIDYKGTFSIEIEGANQLIELNNLTTGYVFVLVGDGWLSDDSVNYTRKVSIPLTNEDVRYFQPRMDYSKKSVFDGEWKISETGEHTKYEILARYMGESLSAKFNAPVGIYNIVWPGMELRGFSNDENLLYNNQHVSGNEIDSLWKAYYTLKRDFDFLADSSYKGLDREVLNRTYDDWEWSETNLPVIVDKRWYLKDKISWWRKKIYLQEKDTHSNLNIDFGIVRGQFDFYFNGNLINRFKGEDDNFTIQIPDSLLKVWTNLLTVRMVALDSLSGLYSEKVTVTSHDSSFVRSISEGWKYRTYYEPPLPEVTKPEGLISPVRNLLVENWTGVNCESIILLGSYNMYNGLQRDYLSKILSSLDEKINPNSSYTGLIAKPSYVDSLINYDKFNYIRNMQLACSSLNYWDILNTYEISPGMNSFLFSQQLSKIVSEEIYIKKVQNRVK